MVCELTTPKFPFPTWLPGTPNCTRLKTFEELRVELNFDPLRDLRHLNQAEVIIGDPCVADDRVSPALIAKGIRSRLSEARGVEEFGEPLLRSPVDDPLASIHDVWPCLSGAEVRVQHRRLSDDRQRIALLERGYAIGGKARHQVIHKAVAVAQKAFPAAKRQAPRRN